MCDKWMEIWNFSIKKKKKNLKSYVFSHAQNISISAWNGTFWPNNVFLLKKKKKKHFLKIFNILFFLILKPFITHYYRIFVRYCGCPLQGCQCFNNIFLRFGVAGLKVVTKEIISLDVLSLFCKAVLRIEILFRYYPPFVKDNFIVRTHHKLESIPFSWIAPTGKINFHGVDVAIPNNHEKVLAFRYSWTYAKIRLEFPYKWKC